MAKRCHFAPQIRRSKDPRENDFQLLDLTGLTKQMGTFGEDEPEYREFLGRV